eukprot:TRINITY_DN78838_c0_g1_i2.p1 TRINITY_DN78838_c0_g1~~TRINITY_DN78838_c0_g1_i2.p1  ORF type:complete len:575 (-),score=183.78 TRINITY_DN78838_c0_g1_i2:78-1802(-)
MGFHAVGAEETPNVTLGLANMSLQAVEAKTRQDEENRRRKDDERKLKRLKADNMPEAIEMISKLNDPSTLRKRTALSLPAPQLNDAELEAIVKMGADAAALQAQSADSSTAGLVQSYGETPGSTPLRTPKQQNTILMEAQDAIARTAMQTPLYGESNPTMNETDWGGVMPTPKSQILTPNLYAEQARTGMTPGATPGMTPGMTPGATPGRGKLAMLGGQTPGTPGGASVGGAASLRDGLALNAGEEDLDQMPEKMRAANQRMQMQAALGSLPAPMNEVEISMPDLMEDEEAGEAPLEEDAADRDKRKALEEQQRIEIERKKRSQPVKMNLPRPAKTDSIVFEATPQAPGAAVSGPQKLMLEAEGILHEEMLYMVKRDAVLFPIKGAKPAKQAPPAPAVEPSLEELEAADEILQAELKAFGDMSDGLAFQAAAEEGQVQLAYVPSQQKCLDLRLLGKKERVEAAQHRFELASTQLEKETKRLKKLEDKLDRLLGGYMQKARQSMLSIRKLAEERETVGVETEVFGTLEAREKVGSKTRVEELEEQVQREKDRNQKLQNRYKALKQLQKLIDDKLQ